MTPLFVASIILFHFYFAWRFAKQILDKFVPDSLAFLGLGIILYYDLGLIFELSGYTYKSPFFNSFLLGEFSSEALAVILTFPWLIYLGWSLGRYVNRVKESDVSHANFRPSNDFNREIVGSRLVFFTICAVFGSLAAAGIGIKFFLGSSSIWESRSQLGEQLGWSVVILKTPLLFLIFWVSQRQSRTPLGYALSILLIALAVISSLAIGQRSAVLIPILVFIIFGMKINPMRLFAFGAALIFLSAAILPLFKWQYSDKEANIGKLIVDTVYSDFHRANILSEVIEIDHFSKNTDIVPYYGAGYVYSSLLLVPRQVAPFKGFSTSTYFTAWKTGDDPKNLRWALAISGLDEIIINLRLIGLMALIPFGYLLYHVDRISNNRQYLWIPIRISCIWICGYDSSVVVNMFAFIIILSYVLEIVFTRNLRIINRSGRVVLAFNR